MKEEKIRLIYQDKEDKECGYILTIIKEDNIEEKIIKMNNNYLDKQNKEEYLLNDKIDILRDIILSKNIGDYIYEKYGSDDLVYKNLNRKKYVDIYKEKVDKKIEKVKQMIKKEILLDEWDNLKEIIKVLYE